MSSEYSQTISNQKKVFYLTFGKQDILNNIKYEIIIISNFTKLSSQKYALHSRFRTAYIQKVN